jgi:hypothetical protein
VSKQIIRDILLLQQRELERRHQEPYVERSADIRKLDNNLIKVILGPRRAGKSFFAAHALRTLGSFGYVNFDDERLLTVVDYDEILNCLDTLYDRPKHLLLDEIQNVSRWELWVNRLQRQGRRVIVTGSNSNLLSQELATHLTGRHVKTLLFPFSFSERLKWMNRALTNAECKEAFAHHVEEGGFPEPLVHHLNRREYLASLLDSVIYKDVVRRFKIRAVQGLEDLASYLLANIAQEYSFRTLTSVTRCKSAHTAEKYLRYLEEAFVFFSVKRFSWKVREQVSSNKKIYCIDSGLATCKAFRFNSNFGRLCENLVAIALRKRELNREAEIFYWKCSQTQQEVDFVVKEGLKIQSLIQVCADARDPKTEARELRALINASKALKCNELILLTDDVEKTVSADWFGVRRKILHIPLWKWLSSRA